MGYSASLARPFSSRPCRRLSLRPKPILSSTTTALMDIMATMASAPLMLSLRLLPLPTEADMATVDTEVAEADMATMASVLLSPRLLLSTTDTTLPMLDTMDTMAKFNTKGIQNSFHYCTT